MTQQNGYVFGEPLPHEDSRSSKFTDLYLTITPAESDLISRIVERAVDLARQYGVLGMDRLSLTMDLATCHVNHYPLELLQLLMTSDDNLSHDVYGISYHMDRRAGKLVNGFKPRHAKLGGPINEGQ